MAKEAQSWEQEVETWDDYAQFQVLKEILAELQEANRYLRGIYDNTPAD